MAAKKAARPKPAKSAPKSAPGVPFQPGADPRRGKGPPPGQGGRPPSEIRQRLRGSFDERVKILEEIADSTASSASDRMKALDLLAKYGLGTQQEVTGKDGDAQRQDVTVRFVHE